MDVEHQPAVNEPPATGAGEDDPGSGVDLLTFRRILVALDASANSRAALHAAAALAEAMHSELLGLFVEDINMLRLAALPFGSEIRFPAAVNRRLDPGEVERQLRMRASDLRREMDEISRARQIQASFRVVRGHVESELLSAADDVDLMALGRLGHSVARRARLGSTAWAATTRSGRPVLLVRPDGDLARPVVVVDDATEAGARGFAAAAGLLRRVGSGRAGELKVLIWAADDESAYERRQLLVEALGQAGVQADFQHFHDAGGERLLELINRQDGGLLVLPVDPSGLPEETVRSLLENARQHVLVIH